MVSGIKQDDEPTGWIGFGPTKTQPTTPNWSRDGKLHILIVRHENGTCKNMNNIPWKDGTSDIVVYLVQSFTAKKYHVTKL